MRSRLGGLIKAAKYDSTEATAPARRAFDQRFERQVDPDGTLSEAERARRAEAARKAYFTALSVKAAKARRMKAAARQLEREVAEGFSVGGGGAA